MAQKETPLFSVMQKIMGHVIMIGLAVVIALEVFHLVGFHFLTVHYGWWPQGQKEVLNGIHSALNLSCQDCNEESLVKRLNAHSKWLLTKEDILKWPRRDRGEYSLYQNGRHVITDWKIYEIDSLYDYIGRLELCHANGNIRTVRIVYEIGD